MARRFVYGSYQTFDEADNVVEELLQQGIREDSVAIVANDNSDVPAMTNKQVLTLDRNETTSPEEENSWWENLLGFLTGDDTDTTDDQKAVDFGIDYTAHQTSLANGEFLVIVDRSYESLLESGDFETDTLGTGTANLNQNGPAMTDVPYSEGEVNPSMENELFNTNVPYSEDPLVPPTTADETAVDLGAGETYVDSVDDRTQTDSESIKLHEERLKVDTHREQVGEVKVTKEVIEDTEVVEVPVQREEVHITHVRPTDDGATDPDAFVEETIEIPISEDHVDISKETVVTDEVRIDRDVEDSIEEVRETTRKEVIDVEDSQSLTHDTDYENRSEVLDDDDFHQNQTN